MAKQELKKIFQICPSVRPSILLLDDNFDDSDEWREGKYVCWLAS